MADSIQNKRNQTTYLRQVQQEKTARKRDLIKAQQEDIKSVRDYYAQEAKNLESQSAAAISHIKEESRALAEAERSERRDAAQAELERKEALRAERYSNNSTQASESAQTNSVEKKNTYNRKTPVVQNYQTKETDGFYQVQDRGSRISENPQGYVIEAYAPEHEKDNLRVSIQKDKAVVSGQRKFADTAEDGKKKMSTNNFQSFREEFKFDRPVAEQGMTRERVGDFVRFSIPKLEAIDTSEDDT